MAENTKIEWTDCTWSPITGCTRVSAGCDHCYSFAMSKRLAAMGQKKYQGITGNGHFNGVVKCWDEELAKPLRWKKRRMIFVNSMSDTFHKDVPFEFIDKMFAVMALCPQHIFQVLTKRPERMAEYMESRGKSIIPPNIWLGTSVEDQQRADERIPHLLRCPAAVRFLSCEPLIEPVTLDMDWLCWRCKFCGRHEPYCDCFPNTTKRSPLDWIICGCESGHHRRIMEAQWAESIADQCRAAGAAFFLKQMDVAGRVEHDIDKFPKNLRRREFPCGTEHNVTAAAGLAMIDNPDAQGNQHDAQSR